MPTNRSLTGPRARLAGLSNWHPGSPEHRAAAQEFYYLLLSQKVEEILAKASTNFGRSDRSAIR